MITYVLWVALSILLALAVFLVASVMERRDARSEDAPGGLVQFWRDFRSGLRRGDRRRTPKPVDTDMDAFFAATVESAPGYVDAEELTDVLQRAREQARHTLHVGHVEVSRPARRSA
ncbi:hypothetical protein [Isoptericola variabilis]|uniref:Uncharacterized protein n=1 Tax=Isoptericola variabilis (strain 225) TaxID=743718 RepID=F6FRU7_ISOV2|nr:hypothetical protein [Isoptericola variabilis]AEG43948.1 hypothetical protein Isova_1179 [Isoptericola variabilis 225]TWH30542.1 hypothetical protein L600_000300000950 [Isoptericola variabilis J7]